MGEHRRHVADAQFHLKNAVAALERAVDVAPSGKHVSVYQRLTGMVRQLNRAINRVRHDLDR